MLLDKACQGPWAQAIQGPQMPVGNHSFQEAVFVAGRGGSCSDWGWCSVASAGLPGTVPHSTMPILGSFPTGHNQDSSAVRNGAPGRHSQGARNPIGSGRAPGFSQTLSILGPDRRLSHDSAVPQGTWKTASALSCLGPFLLRQGVARATRAWPPLQGLEAMV